MPPVRDHRVLRQLRHVIDDVPPPPTQLVGGNCTPLGRPVLPEV